MLPIGPYTLKQNIATHEGAMQGMNDVMLFGNEFSILSGDVYAGVVEDNGEIWRDVSGPEVRYLVAVAPPKFSRWFVLMTQSEIESTFTKREIA